MERETDRVKYFSKVIENMSRKSGIQTLISVPFIACFPSPQMRPDHRHHTLQWIQDTTPCNGYRTLEKLGVVSRTQACLILSHLSEVLEREHQDKALPDPAKGQDRSKKQRVDGLSQEGTPKKNCGRNWMPLGGSNNKPYSSDSFCV